MSRQAPKKNPMQLDSRRTGHTIDKNGEYAHSHMLKASNSTHAHTHNVLKLQQCDRGGTHDVSASPKRQET